MTRKARNFIAITGVLAPCLAATLPAQVTVTGVVREDGTRRALAAVEVLIEGKKRADTTDASGRYQLDAPTGTRIALFRIIGYRPVRIRLVLTKGDTVTADADMVRQQAQQLEPIVTTAAPTAPRGMGIEAFEERRRLGFGKFIDSIALRRSAGRKLMEVLRGVPGLKFVYYVEDPNRPDNYEWWLVGTRREEFDGTPCAMSVVVDGAPIFRSGSGVRPIDFRRDIFPVSSVQALEVYRSASEVPLEFGGPAEQCGLLMLWTRRN